MDRFKPSAIQASMDAKRAEVKAMMSSRLGIDPGSIDYDDAGQLKRLQGGLMENETLYAVYDMKGGGTGFIGITDRRVIIQDEGVIRKKRSLVSIPYGQITLVASADEGGMMRKTSALSIVTTSGKQFDMEFRSGDKAERAYTFMIEFLT